MKWREGRYEDTDRLVDGEWEVSSITHEYGLFERGVYGAIL